MEKPPAIPQGQEQLGKAGEPIAAGRQEEGKESCRKSDGWI